MTWKNFTILAFFASFFLFPGFWIGLAMTVYMEVKMFTDVIFPGIKNLINSGALF